MTNFINAILEYFQHASTWKGLVALITAAGVTIEPVLADKIVALGLSLIGFIQVFIDDRNKT